MEFFRKYKLPILGIITGAILGWLYWYEWGCVETCPIKSNPVYSSIYGAFMGMLLFSMFQKT